MSGHRFLPRDHRRGARRAALTGGIVVVSVLIAPVASAQPGLTTRAARSPAPAAWGTSATAPFGVTAQLFGVAATSGQAWAVGGANPNGAPPTQVLTDPYAEHFDRTGWIATPVPPVTTYGASRSVALRAVTAVSTTDAWGVGSVEDLSSLASKTLAYHWDGTSWTRTPTPNPSSTAGNHLTAVAAPSGQAVYAVGDTGYPAQSLVMRYNGSNWTRVPVPNYGPLISVTADPTGIWVASRGIVARYDGSVWTRLPSVPAGLGTVSLTGLAGAGATLWLVGDDQTAYFEGVTHHPYAARFSNGQWKKLPGLGTSYTGVTTDGTTAWASSTQDTITRFTSTGTALEVTPAPGRLLNSVTTDPSGRQWAVGGGYGTTGDRPAIITSPGIGQGGLAVTTGAAKSTVTWLGPVTGTGTTNDTGVFTVGGLPIGTYTVLATLPGCTPSVATATITQGAVTRTGASLTCP